MFHGTASRKVFGSQMTNIVLKLHKLTIQPCRFALIRRGTERGSSGQEEIVWFSKPEGSLTYTSHAAHSAQILFLGLMKDG